MVDRFTDCRNRSGRQSLVTPIDWKPKKGRPGRASILRRQSLVTPIDWKQPWKHNRFLSYCARRQSLVTPIDWKRAT